MFARSIAAAACILSLFACASSAPEETTDSGDQAATAAAPSCGASYGKALAQYKEAVDLSKLHAKSACEGAKGSDEGAYLTTIAAKAFAATTTCGAFNNVIKTSPWAQPVRDELKGNLALHVITGDLDPTTFKGLDAALASGVTLWGPAPGAYGNDSKVEFGANGHVKFSHMEWEKNADSPTWISIEGTYAIGAVANGVAKISVTLDGSTSEYELKAVSDTYEGQPDFDFRATGQEGPAFTAYVSECEA